MIPRDPLTLHRQLAGLAILEAHVRTALRALCNTYPANALRQCEDDIYEIATARMLVDLCDNLLLGLEDHLIHLSARLRTLQHPEQTAWPF